MEKALFHTLKIRKKDINLFQKYIKSGNLTLPHNSDLKELKEKNNQIKTKKIKKMEIP